MVGQGENNDRGNGLRRKVMPGKRAGADPNDQAVQSSTQRGDDKKSRQGAAVSRGAGEGKTPICEVGNQGTA